MSSLRSAIQELVAEDRFDVPDPRLEEDIDELVWAGRAIQALLCSKLVKADRRRPYVRDGYLSTASWLSHRHRESPAAAAEQVRTARALEDMPDTHGALADGEISSSAVRVLTAAHDAHPEAFSEAETVLVDAARALSHRDLFSAVRYWRNAADAAGAERRAEEHYDLRRLSVSATAFGMVRVDGDLDPETGQTLISALGAMVDSDVRASAPEELRTPAQRRADALGEICRQWLDRSDRPAVAGEKPHVTLTVGLDQLRRLRAGVASCELSGTGPMTPETARRIACDASISRVVLGPRSEPLDVGRRTAVVPSGLRRAVVTRDRHCRFPGCERPEPWCDAHHVTHWADGGPTSLSNLVLLCRRHHRMIHGPVGFRVLMDDGRPVFRRPDGTVLENRAPP